MKKVSNKTRRILISGSARYLQILSVDLKGVDLDLSDLRGHCVKDWFVVGQSVLMNDWRFVKFLFSVLFSISGLLLLLLWEDFVENSFQRLENDLM